MPDGALQRIVESLNQDLEEKIYQLSQLRQVAETVSRGIHEGDYFTQLCSDFLEIFNATTCCLFWQRVREPKAWWLDAWARRRGVQQPSRKTIPEEEEGIFSWIKRLQKPHFLEDATDEPFLALWEKPTQRTTAAIIPLAADEPRMGMLVIVNPIFKLSPRAVQLQLEILGSLIHSGVHNRLLYRGMQESEEEFRDLFENSSDMVVVTYPDGVIRECNPLFRQKLNLKMNPQGMLLPSLITEEKGGTFAECWARLRKGEEVRYTDIHLRREDGGVVEVELSGNVRLLSEGHPGLIRLYLRDLTERHESERRQRKLELELELARERQLAQIGLYVAGIVHNLQNPVQVLLGYIELLKLKGVTIPELNIIEQSTQLIMNIIRNILDKMQKERNPETAEIHINELLESELTFLNANAFFKHEVAKKYQYADDLPAIPGVYSDFSQALMNIVYNAIDAMKDSDVKELKVKTIHDENRNLVRISITDTGPGIRDEHRNEIFKPFFTTKRQEAEGETQTDLSSGSGLGLSSSVALLKPYGGTITFETGVGKGTTFQVSIPIKPPEIRA